VTATRRTTLGECCEIVSGATPLTSTPDYWDGDIEWATPRDLGNLHRKYITRTERRITKEGLASCAATILPPNSVLFSSRAPIGHVAINLVPMATNQGFKSFIPGANELDASFLYHWLRAHRGYLEGLGNGATFKEVSKAVVSRVEINLPTIPEQRRIANILDTADTIRGKRKEAIALTEELLRSVFLDMFGDPVINPKSWPSKLFGRLGNLDRGRSRHRPRNDPSLLGGPYPLIQTGEVANCDGLITKFEHTYSEAGLAQSKIWPSGTLCITIAANIAKTGILTFDACFPDSVVGFTPGPEVTTEYIQYWLSFLQPVLERQAPQVAQKNINLEILRTLEAPQPPSDHQRKFSEYVIKVREARARMRSSLETSAALFDSLVAGTF
jgi:type I restriction enzyme S subunit